MAKKITKATFKSFMKKNVGKLFIQEKSRFDGMYDCVMQSGDKTFVPLQKADSTHENNLGYAGIWLVQGSRDYFREYYDADGFIGINVYNCCGEFTVAIKDPEAVTLLALSK
jgi:hypothetical protein